MGKVQMAAGGGTSGSTLIVQNLIYTFAKTLVLNEKYFSEAVIKYERGSYYSAVYTCLKKCNVTVYVCGNWQCTSVTLPATNYQITINGVIVASRYNGPAGSFQGIGYGRGEVSYTGDLKPGDVLALYVSAGTLELSGLGVVTLNS